MVEKKRFQFHQIINTQKWASVLLANLLVALLKQTNLIETRDRPFPRPALLRRHEIRLHTEKKFCRDPPSLHSKRNVLFVQFFAQCWLCCYPRRKKNIIYAKIQTLFRNQLTGMRLLHPSFFFSLLLRSTFTDEILEWRQYAQAQAETHRSQAVRMSGVSKAILPQGSLGWALHHAHQDTSLSLSNLQSWIPTSDCDARSLPERACWPTWACEDLSTVQLSRWHDEITACSLLQSARHRFGQSGNWNAFIIVAGIGTVKFGSSLAGVGRRSECKRERV